MEGMRLLLLTIMFALSPLLALEVAIPKWPDGKAAALTFTFDDGAEIHATELAPLFARFQIPVTFYVVTGWVGQKTGRHQRASWEQWRDVAAMGHEIGNHSTTHATLPGLKPTQLTREITTSHDLIRSKIGHDEFSYAYPFCKTNPEIDQVVFALHRASRGYFPLIEKAFNRSKATQRVRNGIDQGEWIVWLSHGLDPQVLENHLEEDLSPLNDMLWHATFAQASAWQKVRKSLTWELNRSEGRIRTSLPKGAETKLIQAQLRIKGLDQQARITSSADINAHWNGDDWLVTLPARNGIELQIKRP